MNEKFYFKHLVPVTRSFSNLLNPIAHELSNNGRLSFNISRAAGYESYIPRAGKWTDAFETVVEPSFKMPEFKIFNKTFEEVTDSRALDIAKLIDTSDRNICVSYSGGIDSTLVVVSLLKNLKKEQLKRIKISMSSDSIIENPIFFKNYILPNFELIDSNTHLFSDYQKANFLCVSADLGDCIFGTELGTKFYSQIYHLNSFLPNKIKKDIDSLYYGISNKEISYEEYKDLIIFYFNNNLKKSTEQLKNNNFKDEDTNITKILDIDKTFVEDYYNKIVKNIESSNIEIFSLHDFFWWTIFNLKFMNCALRAATSYSIGPNRKTIIDDCIIHWFGNDEYQLWSMNNNNNGEKIRGTTQGSYKFAAKQYIFNYDKNEFYFYHKLKVASLSFLLKRNYKNYYKEFDSHFAMDTDYNMLYLGDTIVNNFVTEKLLNYK
jgi:hypothetical protein